mmetsp:Transcript_20703/g.30788  ORF Transcript_20703/g.30788 Transcript_20703/m.30788 type:complete len:347 (-) Transcript_20703:168-1208(-)
MRSRSVSPSTSIRSDSDNSDDTSRYANMTEEEVNAIWERRNLAYFDRHQRKLAEERQQQGLSGCDDDSVAHHSSSSDSSASIQEQLGAGLHQLTRPAGFVCAADSPQWRAFTSRNIFGDYDPERASREPAYHNAWISCERLVNMNRSGASAGNFIPTNPRLAALLELRRRDVARERHEEETAMQRQQQFSQGQGGAAQQHNMMVDASSQETPAFAAAVPAAAQQAAQQAAACERLNQAHRLQPSAAHAHHGSNSPKSSSSDSSVGDKSVDPTAKTSYYLALPYPTQQLTKPMFCDQCNCTLYTSPLAKRFFCQTCGSVSGVPVQGADARFEEKMQDAEDQDCEMSY